MKKIKLELVMIFESYVKGYIDCHAFIGNQSISILKLIFENYGYKIDLTLIRRWMISCFGDGCTNTNQIMLFYEGSVGIDKWLKYYGD